MEEDLERVGKVDEVLVVRGEEDSFFSLVLGEVEAEDVVNEEMCLPGRGLGGTRPRREKNARS